MTQSLAGSYNGLSFGPGSKVHVAGIAGFDDMPEVRSFDSLRAGDHGYFRGVDFLSGRQIILTLVLVGDDNNDYLSLVDLVKAAFIVQSQEQALMLYGNTRWIMARPRHRSIPYEADHFARTGYATIDLFASDPRVYDATLTQPNAGLGQLSGGQGFPLGFPHGFGTTTGGYIYVTNIGNFPTRPVITIAGPCDNPKLENVTTGQFMKVNISLGVGDTLTIDFDARSILLNNFASRRSQMVVGSEWFELAAGNTTIRFSADTYNAQALATVAYRSAWI